MKQFIEFVNRKKRASKKHLSLVEKLLKKGGFETKSFLEEDEPFIFVKATSELSFDGIRIYEIGDTLAYRIQKEMKTHPYGKAYELNLEDMFNDYMSENIKEEEAGKKVIETTVEEIKKFFKKSKDAEKDIQNSDETNILARAGGSDYSSLVMNNV